MKSPKVNTFGVYIKGVYEKKENHLRKSVGKNIGKVASIPPHV